MKGSAMELGKSRIGEVMLIKLGGEIGEVEAGEVRQAFEDAFAENCHKLAIDLSAVTFLTSSGLGTIAKGSLRARAKDGFVRLASPQPLIMDVLTTTKLNRLVSVYSDVEGALRDA